MKRTLAVAALLALAVLSPWRGASAEEKGGDVFLDFLKSIKPSFYLDTSYIYNFNDPDSKDNTLRVFDTDHNDFNIHLFQLGFKRTPSLEGGVDNLIGFGVKLDFGEDSDIIGSAGLGDPDDEFDLQEAYINVLVPVGSGLNVYAGKFVTLAGAEVIESKNNFNFSRSFLFGFAIPFTHTGVRASYASGPLSFTLGLNNGWDNVDDNNNGKTIESQIALSLAGLGLYVTGYFGPEQDSGNDWRNLIDIVASFSPMSGLTLVANADYGWEDNVDLGGVTGDANWYGIAGYAAYDLNEKIRLALRAEYFVDDDGFRTGAEQDLFEITPTISIKPFAGRGLDNLEWRIEYRFDSSDEDTFEDEGGEVTDTQHSISTELLYYFTLE